MTPGFREVSVRARERYLGFAVDSWRTTELVSALALVLVVTDLLGCSRTK